MISVSRIDPHTSDLAQKIDAYRHFIHAERDKIDPTDKAFFWYPYDTMAGLSEAASWLDVVFRDLESHAALDIGCGDGLNSFFLESLGFTVHAIDHAETNFNGMNGVRWLHQHLQSSVQIYDVDLDTRPSLPSDHYDIVLCMGLLYHIQNPYWLLKTIARSASYCLLSTRIARLAPDGTNIESFPVAWLADNSEVNNDGSNYWIFSFAGLTRLTHRTGWEICNLKRLGDVQHSDPSSSDRDERVICLLRSKFLPILNLFRLVSGWHQLENGCWRWTERCFSLILPRVKRPMGEVVARFYAPEALLAKGSLTLKTAINGATIDTTYTIAYPGRHEYAVPLPLSARDSLTVHFELSHAIPADDSDQRERGLIFEFFHSDGEEWSPITLR